MRYTYTAQLVRDAYGTAICEITLDDYPGSSAGDTYRDTPIPAQRREEQEA